LAAAVADTDGDGGASNDYGQKRRFSAALHEARCGRVARVEVMGRRSHFGQCLWISNVAAGVEEAVLCRHAADMIRWRAIWAEP
jgi:hypothetical protein